MVPVFLIFVCFGIVVFEKTLAVPPDACFAKFRSDDCGLPPRAVMYYYKPGSRCEVGFWKGCLPNLNMFADEYECVRTCIFVDRARDDDYHNMNKGDEHEDELQGESVTEAANGTDTTDGFDGAGNDTDVGGGNETATDADTETTAAPEAPPDAP